MNKLFIFVIVFLDLLLCTKTLAAENDKILFYKSAKGEKILKKLSANARLIPIYHQGQWIKVGIPNNAQVGWVNKKQVHNARIAFYRPDIQTVYIHDDRNAKGKPELNIVAYRNGKQLS